MQIEEQLRQQLDNQKRFEDMHAIDSISKILFIIKNKIFLYADKTNSDEKFTQLREEHLTVLRRVCAFVFYLTWKDSFGLGR